MRMRRFGWLEVFAAAALLNVVSACDDDDEDDIIVELDAGADAGADAGEDAGADAGIDGSVDGGGDQDIVETAMAAGSFTTLTQALAQTGLDETLAGPGPFTVFAPTDEAFEALGEGALSALSEEELRVILLYHVVEGEAEAADLTAGPVRTLSGFTAFVSTDDGVMINDAEVTTTDVQASNGVIHVIDKVLLPPDLVQAANYAGNFSTLLSAADTAGLTEVLSNPDATLTIFAPTDEAFAALPDGTLENLSDQELANVLTYHALGSEVLSSELSEGELTMLNGDTVTIDLSDGVRVNDATVIVPDIVTTNGVVHAIDGVLIPPSE